MSVVEIPLWNEKTIVTTALVDDVDAEAISEFIWHTAFVNYSSDPWGYAFRWTRGAIILMHREIAGLVRGDGKVVHHLNNRRRDNRRANLVVCSSTAEHRERFHAAEAA